MNYQKMKETFIHAVNARQPRLKIMQDGIQINPLRNFCVKKGINNEKL